MARGSGVQRHGNKWVSKYRDPRISGQVRTVVWNTVDRNQAMEWKKWLDTIRENPDYWEQPPEDCPLQVRQQWFKGRKWASVRGVDVQTDLEPTVPAVEIIGLDGNDVSLDDMMRGVSYHKVDTGDRSFSDRVSLELLVDFAKKRDAEVKRLIRINEEIRRDNMALLAENQALNIDLKQYRKVKIKHSGKSAEDVLEEYMLWFANFGGVNAEPPSRLNLGTKQRYLAGWIEWLGMETMADIELGNVEAVISELRESYKPNSVYQWFTALRSWINWCVDPERGYMSHNPIQGLSKWVKSDPEPGRATPLSEADMRKLLRAAPPDRRICYEVAAATGYRQGELRDMFVRDVQVKQHLLSLPRAYTKNRRSVSLPISKKLMKKLKRLVKDRNQDESLFNIPAYRTARKGGTPIDLLRADLDNAGITTEGINWKSFRRTFINRLVAAKPDAKTLLEMARHKSGDLTLGVYAAVNPDQLRMIVEGF